MKSCGLLMFFAGVSVLASSESLGDSVPDAHDVSLLQAGLQVQQPSEVAGPWSPCYQREEGHADREYCEHASNDDCIRAYCENLGAQWTNEWRHCAGSSPFWGTVATQGRCSDPPPTTPPTSANMTQSQLSAAFISGSNADAQKAWDGDTNNCMSTSQFSQSPRGDAFTVASLSPSSRITSIQYLPSAGGCRDHRVFQPLHTGIAGGSFFGCPVNVECTTDNPGAHVSLVWESNRGERGWVPLGIITAEPVDLTVFSTLQVSSEQEFSKVMFAQSPRHCDPNPACLATGGWGRRHGYGAVAEIKVFAN